MYVLFLVFVLFLIPNEKRRKENILNSFSHFLICCLFLFCFCFLQTKSIIVFAILKALLNLQVKFRSVPFEYVNAMFFPKQQVQADDVLKILKPKYKKNASYQHLHEQMKILIINENQIRSGYLPNLLRTAESIDPKFVTEFVEFATGSCCLPQNNPHYEISVDFKVKTGSHSFDCIIVPYTCVHTVEIIIGSGYVFYCFQAFLKH